MNRVITGLLLSSCLSMGMVSSASAASRLSDSDAVRFSYTALQTRASALGIVSVKDELRPRQIFRDSIGQTHVRFDQYFRGIPVFGEQLVTHLNDQGKLLFLNGSVSPVYNDTVKPTLTSLKALSIAEADFAHEQSEAARVGLVFLPTEDGDLVLSYRVELTDIQSDSPAAHVYFINAHTGDIERDFDNLQTIAAQGTAQTLYLGTVNVTTDDNGAGSFTLTDPSRGGMYTTDMQNGTSGNGVTVSDSDNVWGNGSNSDRATVAAESQYGAEMTWDFYQELFGRAGIKGDGKGSLARVHYGNKYNNAYWSDSCLCMTYGDGDGTNLTPLVSLDVTAHEMSHGVTSATSALTYDKQSGALNESFSDMMGTALEYYAVSKGAQTAAEFWIGEDIYTPSKAGDALRYMDDPSKDGRSIDNASKYKLFQDVHYTSGVANNVFFLMSQGGTNKTSGIKVASGIGWQKAAAIWVRANTTYFTASTNWSNARALTIKAATDLYGSSSTEVTVTGQAWTACGVSK